MSSSSLHITMSRSCGGKSAASNETGAVSDEPSLVRVNEKNGTIGLVRESAEDDEDDELDSERARLRAGCTVPMLATVSKVSLCDKHGRASSPCSGSSGCGLGERGSLS